VGQRAGLEMRVAENSLAANFAGVAHVRGVEKENVGGGGNRLRHLGSELMGGDDRAFWRRKFGLEREGGFVACAVVGTDGVAVADD